MTETVDIDTPEPAEESDPMAGAVLILLTPPSATWSGFVLARLWLWFIVPLGVDPITIWHAAGLVVTISWLAKSKPTKGVVSRKSARDTAVRSAAIPLLVWGLGAIFHAFMVGP